jgi:hypothetical protein
MTLLVLIIAIAAAIVVLGLLFGVIFGVFHLTSRASRGGVQPPPGSRRRGAPPFEGFERESHG